MTTNRVNNRVCLHLVKTCRHPHRGLTFFTLECANKQYHVFYIFSKFIICHFLSERKLYIFVVSKLFVCMLWSVLFCFMSLAVSILFGHSGSVLDSQFYFCSYLFDLCLFPCCIYVTCVSLVFCPFIGFCFEVQVVVFFFCLFVLLL